MPSIANGDVRKDYVLSTVANYFGVEASDGTIKDLVDDVKLNNFLDDGNSLLLSAYAEKLDGYGAKIHLDNALAALSTDNKGSCVHTVKNVCNWIFFTFSPKRHHFFTQPPNQVFVA